MQANTAKTSRLISSMSDRNLFQQSDIQYPPSSEQYEHQRSTLQTPKQYLHQSFRVAKLESERYLQTLEKRLTFELLTVNTRIREMQQRLVVKIKQQFAKFKEIVIQCIEQSFAQQLDHLLQRSQYEFVKLNGDSFKVKKQIEDMQTKVNEFKAQLSTDSWKQAAKYILSAEFETQIENIIVDTTILRNKPIKYPMLAVEGARLQKFEDILYEMLDVQIKNS